MPQSPMLNPFFYYAPKEQKSTEHIVFDTNTTNLHCKNCGAVHVLILPMEISLFNKKLQAMKDLHEDCPKKE